MRLEKTPEIKRVALVCVWFHDVDEPLADPIHFIAHVLTYGAHEDLQTVRNQVSDDELRLVLDQAHLEFSMRVPGLIGTGYWNRIPSLHCQHGNSSERDAHGGARPVLWTQYLGILNRVQ